MKVIFFGTPVFAAKTLSYLLQNSIQVLAVVTKPDKPKGRSGDPVPTPVKLIAQTQNPPIPVYQADNVSSKEFALILSKYHADLFVVVAFGEIIKQNLLDMPKLGCINVHASLLPKYRGAAPIQRSIIENESETGVTIMHMVRKMDAGDMIKTAIVKITSEMTFGELENELCEVGSKALLDVIKEIDQGIIRRIPQDHSQATHAAKIELEDCEIHWNRPAQEIHNLVRGVNPYPGAWCYVLFRDQKKRLKINQTRIHSTAAQTPGSILESSKDSLVVSCLDGSLEILELQLEGKKRMNVKEFLAGISKKDLLFNPES